MKQVFTVALLVASLLTQVSAQQNSSDLPNYMLASNSNFVVMFYTPTILMTGTNRSFVGTEGRSYKKVTADDFESLDEAMFNAIINETGMRLEKMGLKPKGFLNVSMADYTDPEKYHKYVSDMLGYAPYYTLGFTVSDVGKASKSLSKGEFSLATVKTYGLGIAKTGEKKRENIYGISGGSMDDLLTGLETAIKSKPKTYFVQEVEGNQETLDEMQTETDLLYKINNEINSYPSDLKSTELLVMLTPMLRHEQVVKYMEDYPYKYTIITSEEIEKYADGHRYLLTAVTSDIYQKHSTVKRVSPLGGTSYKTTTFVEAKFFLLIKDMETLDAYLGNNGELKNFESDFVGYLIKSAFKSMGEHYKW